MLPMTVRTPFSFWNFSNSFLCLGTPSLVSLTLGVLAESLLLTECRSVRERVRALDVDGLEWALNI